MEEGTEEAEEGPGAIGFRDRGLDEDFVGQG